MGPEDDGVLAVVMLASRALGACDHWRDCIRHERNVRLRHDCLEWELRGINTRKKKVVRVVLPRKDNPGSTGPQGCRCCYRIRPIDTLDAPSS